MNNHDSKEPRREGANKQAQQSGCTEMQYVGIDVHKQDCQVCIMDRQGEITELRIRTTRERLRDLQAEQARAKILLEVSTESEWVARCLEELGHEVIVADPNFAPMYATRSKKVKTDKRDARALAEAAKLGAYRQAHRTSDEKRHIRTKLSVRAVLVKSRATYILMCGALLRQRGDRVASGGAEGYVRRVEKLTLEEGVQKEITPLLLMMEQLNDQIERMDKVLEKEVAQEPEAQRLCTMPSIGPVTALAFVAAIDGAQRFSNAHQVESYLGLVPREYSSGEKQSRGRITKCGNAQVRRLLVQAAQSTMRLRKPETARLWLWATGIQKKRGKKIAVVALARRIAGILWAMMRDKTPYQEQPGRIEQMEEAA